ncbi:flavin monoamine oxidase family protein [Acinetobacter sp. ANC 3813]|uniref:flavin monoamine oxidase family protein n=1 Tax=Acinetobacter sp. ANC 3813 TaxID=1977873 RepID=UPI000A352468|nr:NAD(P)/FAD-dependent oxidoreductase [Acinetobacter sp. ANC 3813]OTG91970.1 hypothetical protein B9T34_01075 [Acinetobacter sp. ANC 3813]
MTHTTGQDLPIYIIGAGIAGISCAKQLQDAGKKVIILESRDRIGGRIESKQINNDFFDLGASWIHGIKGNPIWALSQQLHIETQIFNYNKPQYFHATGQLFNESEVHVFESYIRKIQSALFKTAHESALVAVQDIINSLDYQNDEFAAQDLKTLLLTFFQYVANDPYATDLEQLSSQYQNYEGYFEGDEVIFPKGYAQIIHHLAQDLQIQRNIHVQKISIKSGYAEIQAQNNQTFQASKIVIAVPLGVLKKQHIQFNPPLPDAYCHAIKNMGFGSFNKVFFQLDIPLPFCPPSLDNEFSTLYWNNNKLFNLLDLTQIYQKPTYLMLFGGSVSDFIDHADDDAVWDKIGQSLQETFQTFIEKPKNLLITRWGADSNSYGSFSFPALKQSEQLTKVFEGNIDQMLFFSGEHCSLKYAGTVHGAYLSGCETARQLLNLQIEM